MKDDNTSGASLSFLDVIACAFGAIVLLVLIIPIGERGVPAPIPDFAYTLGQLLYNVDDVQRQISTIEHQIEENQGIVDHLSTEIASLDQQNQMLLSTIQSTITETQNVSGMTEILSEATVTLDQSAGEMEERKAIETEVAGIPIDAEYVAFVVDTSGSMGVIQSKVRSVLFNLLDLYPDLEGIQILNDQGFYIERAGSWIPDSPTARNRLSRRFRSWAPFSQSDPGPGIRTAIEELYEDDMRMAVFVLGDDYASSNVRPYIRNLDHTIQRKNVQNGKLRVHAVAFSNFGMGGFMVESPVNFIVVMRELTKRYDGVLVAVEPDRPTRLQLRRSGSFVRPG